MKKLYPFYLVSTVLLCGCLEDKSYYLSPSNAGVNPYHAIPMKSDSVKGATYASLLFAAGAANQHSRDGVLSFRGSIHRSHNFGNFQAFYGSELTLGNYSVAEYHNYTYRYQGIFGFPYAADSGYNISARNAFFGSYGVNGGIDVVSSFRNGSEWRVIGVEGSLQSEFGNYKRFRKDLPDTAANIIFRKTVIGSLGLYSDIISRPRVHRHGIDFGYKIGWGLLINSVSDYTRSSGNSIFPLSYFSQTLHLTRNNVTGFIQFNLGSFATNLQLGVNYQLGRPISTNRSFSRTY